MNILYLVDNKIMYYSKVLDTIIVKELSVNVLRYGRINDSKEFYKKFSLLLDQNNLLKLFSTLKVLVIVDFTYTKVDKDIIKNVLSKINFSVINFIDEIKILEVGNKVYINSNNEYAKIYYKENGVVTCNFITNKVNSNNNLVSLFVNGMNKDVYLYGNRCILDTDYYEIQGEQEYLIKLLINGKV